MTPAIVLLAALSFSPPGAGARIELGRQIGRFWVEPGARVFQIPDYRNNGYVQKVTPKGRNARVEVRVVNSQLASKARSRKVSQLPAELGELERRLNQTRGFLADQVSLVFEWLRAEIDYETRGSNDQSVAAVLAKRRANCVGLANLGMFILHEMGVETRYVTGVAFKREDPSSLTLEGDVLHRWLEIRYDDVGWVFCDPAGKVNFVEASYLVLGVQGLHPLPVTLSRAVGARVELRDFKDGLRAVGAAPHLESRLRLRPNRLFVYPREPQ